MKISFRSWALTAAVAAALVACGGGGSDTTPRQSVSAVKVFGDSLADVGTYGYKFTVQGSDSLIFPERVGLAYGLGAGCNFFQFTGATFVPNATAGCKNYAIGGSVVSAASAGLTVGDPRIVSVQMAAATAGGNFAAGDLLIVDGGSNDAIPLVGAYLKAGTPVAAGGDGGASYVALLGSQLTPAQVGAAVAGGAAGLATAGGQYLTALAGVYYNTIKAGALDKGAQRVIVVNLPTITNTPRLQMVLDSIAAANGGGATGAAARAQVETVFRGWVSAFNAELARRVSGDARIVLFDVATNLDDAVANPAQLSIANIKTPTCPITGVGSDGLPTYTFPTCTAAALSAAPPAGVAGGANWWRTYYFADGIHPTPYGHQLAYQAIAKVLATAGWL